MMGCGPSSSTPVEDDAINPAKLRKTEPAEIETKRDGKSEFAKELQIESIDDPLVKQDLSRRQFSSVPDFQLGVTVKYLLHFIEKYGGRECFKGMTTSDINDYYVKPATLGMGVSLVEVLNKENSAFVGKSEWFISHAWKYPFLDVVDAIVLFMRKKYGENADGVFIWFDVFSVYQNYDIDGGSSIKHDFEWWSTTFKNEIKAISRVLMVMHPWDRPVTLTRVWCIYEIYCCTDTGSTFEITMTKAEGQRFLQMMLEDGGAYNKMLANVCLQNGDCFDKNDKDAIFGAVRNMKGGFIHLDSTVLRCLENELGRFMEQAIEDALHDEKNSELYVASLKSAQARLLQDQGKYSLAESLFEEVLRVRKRILGERHRLSMISLTNLANLYQSKGDFELAEKMHSECLNYRRDTIGSKQQDTLMSMNSLAYVYDMQMKYVEAETLYQECLDLREKVLGKEHESTLQTLNDLGSLFNNTKRYADAQEKYQQCYDVRKRVLGDDHPDTLTSRNNLAGVMSNLHRYAEAEDLYKRCVESSRRVHGDDSEYPHPNTLAAQNNLAYVYDIQGRFAEAESLYKLCLKGRENVLDEVGKVHPRTLDTVYDLANLYYKQDRLDEAEPLFLRCVEGNKRILRAGHPDIGRSIKGLIRVYDKQGKTADVAKLSSELNCDSKINDDGTGILLH